MWWALSITQVPPLYSEPSVSLSQTQALAPAQCSLRFQHGQKLTSCFLNVAVFVATTRGGKYHRSWIFCLAAGHGAPWVWRKLQLQLWSKRETDHFTLPGPNSPLLLRLVSQRGKEKPTESLSQWQHFTVLSCLEQLSVWRWHVLQHPPPQTLPLSTGMLLLGNRSTFSVVDLILHYHRWVWTVLRSLRSLTLNLVFSPLRGK